ncbi:MAG: G5 domain-containing protein, partial [Syntrophomonadaceae bacterium]|nr:G5 domain-containing protein [Syntrophomonadaceae bacterium]
KFINNTPANLIIQTRMGRDRITVQLFGRRVNSAKVTVLSEVVERYEPRRVERPNPELTYGQQLVEQKGRAGAKIKVYRLLEEGGVTRKELVSIDTYRPVDELVQVGTKPQETPPAGGAAPPEGGGTSQAPSAPKPEGTGQ